MTADQQNLCKELITQILSKCVAPDSSIETEEQKFKRFLKIMPTAIHADNKVPGSSLKLSAIENNNIYGLRQQAENGDIKEEMPAFTPFLQ